MPSGVYERSSTDNLGPRGNVERNRQWLTLRGEGYSLREIGIRYGVTKQAVGGVVLRSRGKPRPQAPAMIIDADTFDAIEGSRRLLNAWNECWRKHQAGEIG